MPIPSQIERAANDSADGALHESPPALRTYYDALFAAHGPQHWWPGRTAFEVIVGAILTQNTSWSNVQIAIRNLRRERLLTPRAIEDVSFARLARLVRSSGYFRQKAKKLKCFVRFLRSEYGVLERHKLATSSQSYEDIRQLFEGSVPGDAPLYNEFHALIVRTGKEYCRTRNPRCSECPLHSFLPQAIQASL